MEASKIQWTDNTYNIAVGCSKVNKDCLYCYMMREFEKRPRWEEVNGTVIRTEPATFNKPLLWQKKGLKSPDGRPLKVFAHSLTDNFHPSIDPYRHEYWNIVRQCPDLIFQMLTKRIERYPECLPDDWESGKYNVWMGVSAGHQKAFIEKVRILGEVPAKVRFMSLEPLTEPIDLGPYLALLDWVIVGGESGNDTGKWRYRPCELDWIQSIVDQCYEYNVPVFVKQMGTYIAKKWGYKDRNGGKIDEWPRSLQVRQFPTYYEKLLQE